METICTSICHFAAISPAPAMPIVTLTVCKPKTAAFIPLVLHAVHSVLVASGAPLVDKFRRVIELAPADFRVDSSYPDLRSPCDQDFVLLETLGSGGQKVKVKRKLLIEWMALLADSGLDTERMIVAFNETVWENWAFGGGMVINARQNVLALAK